MAEYYKRVHSFEDILRLLVNDDDIWDNVFVVTDVDSYVQMPFYYTTDETLENFDASEVYYELKTRVHYTDHRGDNQMVGFILTTTNFNLMLEVEEKVRKIIPMIYE